MSVARRLTAAASFIVVALVGCGPQDLDGLDSPGATADLARARHAIIGGTVDNGDPAVVALAQSIGGGQFEEFCTGTLIAPQTVLSAGHCVDPQTTAYAVFGSNTLAPTQYVKVVQQIAHPNFNINTLSSDISVWKLQTPVTNVTPLPYNKQAMSAGDVGTAVRHVGFGVTNAQTQQGSDTKRQVSYQIRAVSNVDFESGATGKQTCFGDSGGPAFAQLSGSSQQTVIGVVSWGDQNCATEGYDTRVDLYATSFVEPTMNQWETPQCTADGRCKAGCTPVDPDCACAQDGVCSAQCADPSKDPDCPVDCGANGVCALDVCGAPDPDCVGIGQSCASDVVCNPRTCVSDPQHSGKYCSKPCTSNAQCPSTMVCDSATSLCQYPQRPTANIGEVCDSNTYCNDGGVCAGDSLGNLHCEVPCSGPGTCPGANETCVSGVTGSDYCAQPKTGGTDAGTPGTDGGSGGNGNGGSGAILPRANVQGTNAASCSSTGGSPVWALGLFIVALGLLSRRGRKVGAFAFVTALVASACGPTEESPFGPPAGPTAEQLASKRQPIVGGTTDNGDPEVFELYVMYDNGQGSSCTGTLIANRTIATAAHCSDPSIANANTADIYVMNETQESQFANWIHVVDKRIHPGWNTQSLDHDVSMLLLQTAPAAPKKAWNATASQVNALGGKTVRAVGYGITSNQSQDSGTKRQVNLVIDQLDSTHIYIGNNVNKGICHGDSGGPSFYTFPDGVERLIAIHSYDANGNCTYGGDIRTDSEATFINQWLTDKEGPQCTADGACKQGCAPVDPDCYCLADNFCDARCPNLAQDPDCPKDCVANGVCSIDPCPVVDADCVAEGSTCTSELQCKGRVCIKDAQHTDFYCSRPCTTSTECPGTMECVSGACEFKQLPTATLGDSCTIGGTYCTGNTVCTGGVSSNLHCEAPCSSNADCGPTQTCEAGQGGVNYCKGASSSGGGGGGGGKTPVYVTRAKIDGAKVAGGCAATGSGPFGLLGLLSLAMIWRRRVATPRS